MFGSVRQVSLVKAALQPLKQFRQNIGTNAPALSTVACKGRERDCIKSRMLQPLVCSFVNSCQLSTSLKGAAVVPDPASEEPSQEKITKPVHKKTEVTFEEVVALIDNGSVYLYDVREPKEVEETGLLPNAVNIPLTKLKSTLQMEPLPFQEQFNRPKPVKEEPQLIFYGLCSVKSTAAVEIAYKLGFKKARHFPGGWEEWSKRKSSSS